MTRVYLLSPREELLEAFDEAGLDTTAILSEDQEYDYSDAFEPPITVKNILDPIEVMEALLDSSTQYGDENVVCVGLGDKTSVVASAVNELLGIGRGMSNPLRSLLLFKNKAQTRKMLAAKLPALSGYFAVAHHYQELEKALEQNPSGIVVKPIDGSGSRDVIKVSTADELASHESQIVFPALVEELFTGKEYSVEVLSIDGIHQPLAVTEKILGGVSGLVEVGQLQPARIDEEVRQLLFDATSELLTVAGIEFGLSHTEIILQEGQPKIVESHGRVGGDRIADLLAYTTGTDAFTRLAHAVAYKKFLPIEPKAKEARIDYVDLHDVNMTDFAWIDRTLDEPDVVKVRILKARADRGDITCSADRHAFVIKVVE